MDFYLEITKIHKEAAMKKRSWIMLFFAMALIPVAAPAFSADDQETIYGSQLMTKQERVEFRQKMRNAQTTEEREQLRLEHHAQMQERAKEKGLTLPDEPMPKGAGMGSGQGMGHGGGMGYGSGKGTGTGKGMER